MLRRAQVRVYNTEVLTGVDTPAQYCTKAYFKVRAPAPRRRRPQAGAVEAVHVLSRCRTGAAPSRWSSQARSAAQVAAALAAWAGLVPPALCLFFGK